MFMVYDLNVFQIVFNHKQFENKKTGLKIEGVSDCCITPNELFQLYHGENRLLKVVLNTIKLTLNIKQM
jgi:hypothetical protein